MTIEQMQQLIAAANKNLNDMKFELTVTETGVELRKRWSDRWDSSDKRLKFKKSGWYKFNLSRFTLDEAVAWLRNTANGN